MTRIAGSKERKHKEDTHGPYPVPLHEARQAGETEPVATGTLLHGTPRARTDNRPAPGSSILVFLFTVSGVTCKSVWHS